MNDFIFHNPDKVYFGKHQLEHLPKELLKLGKRVLLVYGGGSIKKSGLYDTVMDLLQANNLTVFEAAVLPLTAQRGLRRQLAVTAGMFGRLWLTVFG